MQGRIIPFSNGTVTIPAGQTCTNVTIPILEDQTDEPNETFTVNLANPQNGTIADPQGTVTIIDNDDSNGGATCKDVVVTDGGGKVSISNIPAGAKIEYNGPSTGWAMQLVCESNCGSSQTINNLASGDYNVKVQTFGDPYCYANYPITVTGGGGNPCDRQGGDSDGDGVCDNQDNCRTTANPDQADNDNDGIGNVCDDTPNGGGGSTCKDVVITDGGGKINITNIPAGAKIEYNGPSTGWGVELVCNDNCGSSQTINDLQPGDYNVKVQTFSHPYCYANFSITVTGGSGGNPCDNQGGDSDGDGICDNQDNCKYTANSDQADNDNDGIGNVCDDSPNGNGGTPSCDNVTASFEGNEVVIRGLIAPIVILKVFDPHWNLVFECGNTKCLETIRVGADPNEGKCFIDVQFYTADWQQICHRRLDIGGDTKADASSSRNAPQLEFAAFRQDRAVALQWLTNSGWRNDHFELERSTDGENFESINKIVNNEETDELAYYENVDKQPAIGTNYYRVKQIHKDGSHNYTDIQAVNFEIDLDGFSVYPNPAGEVLNFNMKAFGGKAVTIQLVSHFGQVLKTVEMDEIENENVQLSLADIPNGFYQVVFQIEGQAIVTKKVIVEKLY